MNNRKAVSYLGVLAGAMLVLTACGGGGGGGDTAAPAPVVSGSVSGVAAKGIIANGVVTAYCGNSQAPADQLATGVTNAAGEYQLSWSIACSKPVLLVVTAGTATTMADEATGTTMTPAAGFALRALLADPDTTTVKNITPLTDMAAAIAGSSATLTKAAAANAENAVINTVLGGDIGAYQAKPLAPTAAALTGANADEQKLATVLTAISAFAQDDATCKTKLTDAERIQCATEAFAAQAKATVTGTSDTGYTVNPLVPARTPAMMLADTLGKIKTEAASGTPGGMITAAGPQALSSIITSDSSGVGVLFMSANASVLAAAGSGGLVAVSADYGIQAARNLFNSLKTDLLSLSDGSGTGYLDQKMSAMDADWTSNGIATVTGFQKNLDALKRAVELAEEAKTAILTVPGSGVLAPNTIYPVFGGYVALVTDSNGDPDRFLRSHPDGMNCYVGVGNLGLGKAGCYYGYGQPNVPSTPPFTGYYHAVEVAETSTSGTYAWNDYLASRTYTATTYSNPGGYFINGNGNYVRTATAPTPISAQQAGTITLNWGPTTSTGIAWWTIFNPDGSVTDTFSAPLSTDAWAMWYAWTTLNVPGGGGDITAMSVQGNIQPLVAGQDYSTLDLSGAHSLINYSQAVASLTGTVTNVKAGATTLSMALGDGSQVVHTMTYPDHEISAKLVTQIKTLAFQYDGTFIVNGFTPDLSGQYEPTNASFSGAISTLSGGTASEFLKGTLGATISNMAAYDPNLPDSASNFQKGKLTFGGKATNGGKTYELTFIADRSTFGQESVTLNYSSAGSQMISATATNTDATYTTVVALKGSGGINAVLTNGVGDVFVGTTKVGSVTENPSQLNFIDGTYLLLGM